MKNQMKHELNRGVIGHSAMAAMVTSNLFRPKTERNAKGKGSYQRKMKNNSRGSEGYDKAFFH
jgi:Uncharacterized protein conserved in bacteria